MTKTHKITTHGQTVTTRTDRRFAVLTVRAEPIRSAHGGWYVAFASVEKRTDNLATARTQARKCVRVHGLFPVIIDLTTGEEVR